MEENVDVKPVKEKPKGVRDKWSKLYREDLIKEIRKITMACNNGKGMSIPQSWQFGGTEWEERQMRDFLRFLYANLKETYIAKVQVLDGLEKEQKEEGGDDYYA